MFTIWTYLIALHEPCDPETCEFVSFTDCPGNCVQGFCATGNPHLSDDVMEALYEFLEQNG